MHGKLIAIAALGATILVVTGVALADSSNERTAAKQATASFAQLGKAKAAGYAVELKTTPANGAKSCIADPAGGMGVHMVNPTLLDGAIKLRSPEALVYEPRGNALKLVALEYVVDRKAWHAAGNTQGAEAVRPRVRPGHEEPVRAQAVLRLARVDLEEEPGRVAAALESERVLSFVAVSHRGPRFRGPRATSSSPR